jgi:hypothetical protein
MTQQQLKAIYKALKGSNLLGILQANTTYNRQSVWNTFNTPDIQYCQIIVDEGIRLLKEHNILNDYALLTELLND